MLSSAGRHPLNSTTATVSSSVTFSFLSSSSSSSSSAATCKHKKKGSALCTSSSISLSLFSSFTWLFLVALYSHLMNQALVCSAPTFSLHNFTSLNHNIFYNKQLAKENHSIFNSTFLEEEMPQNDQPPRSIYPSHTVPFGWKVQPHNRFYYLRADNDQFLQFFGYAISGTKERNPALGVVRFFSEEQSIVIRGLHEEKFLCMNATFGLYLSDKVDPECYIEELSLQDIGSLATAYSFTKYRNKNQKLYLGINCDPVLGNETNPTMKEVKFNRVDISEDNAYKLKSEIQNSGLKKHFEEKCERVNEKRQAVKNLRRKLRERWCWNIDRMGSKAHFGKYMNQCREREGKGCNRTESVTDPDECFCDILSKMLANPKRTKRKCLADKITKWVENQNMTSNSKAILEVSRLLLPSYAGIARRMRLLKSKQHTQKVAKPHISSEQNKKTSRRTSTQNPQTRNTISLYAVDSSERKSNKFRRPVIKLNSILKKYRPELILSPESPSRFKLQSDTNLNSNASPASIKDTDHSVLSDEFKSELNSLMNTQTTPKPHKKKKHPRKKERRVSRPKSSHT